MIEQRVHAAVADVLGLYDEEVLPDASLKDDYGAEDAELAEILQSVSSGTGVALGLADLRALVRGQLSLVSVADLVALVSGATARAA